MIKQMLKLVWNRKRTNVLIIVEIFFSFLVLFAIASFGAYYARNYATPLGFSYERVWCVSLGSIMDLDFKRLVTPEENRQIMLAMRDMPEVEGVAGIGMSPFQVGSNEGPVAYKGREADRRANDATDELKDVMGLDVIQGRWFEPADDALSYQPVVINQRLRDELFGAENPIGKAFDPEKRQEPGEKPRQSRVIGVITNFRQHGEFHEPYNYCFYRRSTTNPADSPLMNLLVKLRPGTTAAFEEKLMSRLRSVSKDISFQIEPLSRARRSHMKLVLAPVVAGAMVAVFLTIMVGLGMVGVLWQNVSRRTKEIGLRRALGGSAGDVYKQVLGELIVIATVGLLLGVAAVVQVPLLGIVDWMTPGIFAAGLAVALLMLYGLTIAAGLYPSWLATKVLPAWALHYE